MNMMPNSDIPAELRKLTKDLQKQITAAGLQGENEKIFALAERLRRAVALAQKYQGIQQEIVGLIDAGNSDSGTKQSGSPAIDFHKNGSGAHEETRKERGDRLRSAWIAGHGKLLKWLRGALYRNSKGEVVGIACAREKMGPDGPMGRWWLGLPGGQFESAVLLCERSDGHLNGVCLPQRFIAVHRAQFSKSTNGQEQFNVLKNDIKWYLHLPKAEPIDVTMFVDNPAPLL